MGNYPKIIKAFIPPAFQSLIYRLKGRQFYGNYASWDDAMKECTVDFGPEFIEEIKSLNLKVKNGQAAFTRDLVLFDEFQYNWPFLTALFQAASLNNGSVGVLDFGGSLGNVYFQHRNFFSKLKIRWCIVDIEPIVDIGRKEFQDNELVFYHSINECLSNENINLILISGVLQCLKEPETILDELLSKSIPSVFIDRTPFILSKANDDLLTIQKLPEKFGNARIPHWFFDKNKFLKKFFDNGYHLLAEWQGIDWANIRGTEFKGFIFENTTP